MVSQTVSGWLPNRPPTWGEIAIAVLFSPMIVGPVAAIGSISLVWAAVGFVLIGLLLGPISSSSFGKELGRLFRTIHALGRFLAIFVITMAIWNAMKAVHVPIATVSSLLTGVWAALVVYLLAHLAQARTVEGVVARKTKK